MSDNIKVSVLVATYNHEKYIRHALDGILMQRTSFIYEILVHDDASTDHTADIIREYEKKYPEKFRVIYQKENQYSKGIKINPTFLFPIAKGEYIAFCEGDDYWTDESKLQKQVEILDNNLDCSGCVCNSVIVDDVEIPWKSGQNMFRATKDVKQGIDYLNEVALFSHFATVMLRRSLFSSMSESMYEEMKNGNTNGDMLYAAIMAANGNVYHIAQDMACYRCVLSGTTSWTSRTADKNISLITFNMLKFIQAFIKKYYDKDVSYKKLMRTLCYISVRKYHKNKSEENARIMQIIMSEVDYSCIDYYFDLLRHFILKLRK